MKSRLVIYHGDCRDGFTAAWAAWKKFGDEDTEYVAAKHGETTIPIVKERDVYFLDFAIPRASTIFLHDVARSLIVLDHHKTAAADLAGLPYATFDMDRSGAGIAWDVLHPGVKRPWLINYVEDRDLWRFKLPESKEINAWVGAAPSRTFADWDVLERGGTHHAANNGRAVLAYIDGYVLDMAKHAIVVDFDGYKVPVVNAPFAAISELLGHLAESAPFALGWFQRGDGMYQYSLRSRGPDGVDVSEVAKRYGGGGHRNAAGFQLQTPLCLLDSKRCTGKSQTDPS